MEGLYLIMNFTLPPVCTAIVKNKTDKDICNLEFIWVKRPDLSGKIKKIKKGDFKRIGVGNLVEGVAPLKMYYLDENNYRNEYTIFEELQGLVERLICITLLGIYEDGGLEFSIDPNYELPL